MGLAMAAFIHGIILAFGLIIPLGMQNVFVFNQGVSQPKLRFALPSVLTAFVCDTTLIILAVLGISLVVLQFAWLKLILFVFGFIFLMYMGFVTWKTKPAIQQAEKAFSFKRQIYFAASVSILNPHAVLDTIGVIGTNSLSYYGHHKFLFCVGCILVSLVWFVGLAMAGNFVKKFDSKAFWLHYLNKVSALVIWGVGFYILCQILICLKNGGW
jgi:L-lysine exporter family protein LysE/ArgO